MRKRSFRLANMRLSTMCVLIIFLIALCATASECGADSVPYSVPHRRVRRQTSDPFTQECIAILSRATCSTSFSQNFINVLSRCGNRSYSSIQETEKNCQKNDEGRYCGDVLSYFNCSTSSCSRACTDSLQQAGCCANLSSFYSYYLRVCGISVPSPCPKSSLTLPTVTVDDSCDSEIEYTNTEITALCDNVNPVLEDVSQHKMCESTVNWYRTYCSSRNGQYCLVEFNYNSPFVSTIQQSETNCSSVSNCSIACKSSLILIKNTVGCCFHALNTIGYFGSITDNPSLWNECGISIPQRCKDGAARITIGLTVIITIIITLI